MSEPAEPFQLDGAAKPGAPFTFTFRGLGYVLPPVQSWPITIMTMLSNGLVEQALADLLGEERAQRLADDGMTVGHMSALMDEASKPDR
ncbi:MAG TPA: hypothetical protein VH136_18615 [Trebonia sp.]|jgi:hypothetical protein|nr:hypothetical protein [Trebonia sp.]